MRPAAEITPWVPLRTFERNLQEMNMVVASASVLIIPPSVAERRFTKALEAKLIVPEFWTKAELLKKVQFKTAILASLSLKIEARLLMAGSVV